MVLDGCGIVCQSTDIDDEADGLAVCVGPDEFTALHGMCSGSTGVEYVVLDTPFPLGTDPQGSWRAEAQPPHASCGFFRRLPP